MTIGTRVRVRGTLRDEDGALLTGKTVTAQAKKADGSTVSPSVTEPSSGVYQASVDGDVAGTIFVRYECANPLVSGETSFEVEESRVE